jgi:hypothetical protein
VKSLKDQVTLLSATITDLKKKPNTTTTFTQTMAMAMNESFQFDLDNYSSRPGRMSSFRESRRSNLLNQISDRKVDDGESCRLRKIKTLQEMKERLHNMAS